MYYIQLQCKHMAQVDHTFGDRKIICWCGGETVIRAHTVTVIHYIIVRAG